MCCLLEIILVDSTIKKIRQKAHIFARKLVSGENIDSLGMDQDDYSQIFVLNCLGSLQSKTIENLPAWINQIARNQYAAYLEKRTKIPKIEVTPSSYSFDGFVNILIDIEKALSKDDFDLFVDFCQSDYSIRLLQSNHYPEVSYRTMLTRVAGLRRCVREVR